MAIASKVAAHKVLIENLSIENAMITIEEEAQKFIAASRFKPSNKQLLKKVYSVLLDRQAPSQSDWDKIQCGVVIIQGGA